MQHVLRPILLARSSRHAHAEARPEVRLFQGIPRQRVAWVQEAGRPGSPNEGGRTTIVEEIVW
jgi:hypothetical protein